MSRFLIIFFSIYGSMHIYCFFKAKRGLSLNRLTSFFLLIFMLFMTISPMLIRMAERNGMERLPLLLAFISYSWMGMLFFFVIVSLLSDIYRLILYTCLSIFKKHSPAYIFPQSKFFYASFALALFVSLYSFYEAQNFSVERLVIETEKIPADAPPVKIIQISDLHIGLIIRDERVKELAERIREEAPDILVATGDIIDGQSTELDGISGFFADIKAPRGKYAILGNHEFYVGLDHSIAFLKKAGFRILRNEALKVSDYLTMVGVDDEVAKRFDEKYKFEEQGLLASLPEDVFTVLLKHRPVLSEGSVGLFDLQLSGHTHNGQIFPFGLAVRHFYPYVAGITELSQRSKLYTNRGTGTWGPPMRFLAPPEITLIEIRGKKKQ